MSDTISQVPSAKKKNYQKEKNSKRQEDAKVKEHPSAGGVD